ncbi:MAG: acetylglutamate kinase [Bacteroidota bacterium]
MTQTLSIVKIGGNLIEDDAALHSFLTAFSELSGPKILVHGGGKKASEVLNKLGIAPKMLNGRRITDKATLEVVIMVYGGLVNKSLVAGLQALGCNALGMSGADANAIQAEKRPVQEIDYGFAGDITAVNRGTLDRILQLGLTPVFCALTHDGKGQLLNTNADTIASEIAIRLSDRYQTVLYYCFELPGVLEDINDPQSIIAKINGTSYQKLVDKGIIAKGMLPKMHNAFASLKNGVREVRIGNLNVFQKEKNNYTTLVE